MDDLTVESLLLNIRTLLYDKPPLDDLHKQSAMLIGHLAGIIKHVAEGDARVLPYLKEAYQAFQEAGYYNLPKPTKEE